MREIFFFRYDTNIFYEDKIVEISLDTEGKPVSPLYREAIYKPSTLTKYRSDYGRIEFIAAYCKEEDAWRFDK